MAGHRTIPPIRTQRTARSLQSIYARDLFWEKAAPKLKDLDDRIGPDDIGRLCLAIHARIPRPTKAERTQLALFDAQHKADPRRRKANEKPIAVATNILKLRRRRPDWQRREPRRPEMHKWYEQYRGWTLTAKATARMVLLNEDEMRLPEAAYYAAYYDDDEPPTSDR